MIVHAKGNRASRVNKEKQMRHLSNKISLMILDKNSKENKCIIDILLLITTMQFGVLKRIKEIKNLYNLLIRKDILHILLLNFIMLLLRCLTIILLCLKFLLFRCMDTILQIIHIHIPINQKLRLRSKKGKLPKKRKKLMNDLWLRPPK